MRSLIYLFLLSPVVVANTGNWWEEKQIELGLGVFQELFDDLLALNDSEMEKEFYTDAETVKSLVCRSEIYFDKSNRNMMQCLKNAEEEFVKEVITLLEFGSGIESGISGLKYLGYQFYNIQPNMAAVLIMKNKKLIAERCINENQTSRTFNKTDTVFIQSCVDDHINASLGIIDNADKYTRVKYLQRRGLLISNDQIEMSSAEEIVDLSDYEISNLRNELERELVEVYCRSSIGILYVVDAECEERARNKFLDDFDESAEVDIKNLELDYLGNKFAALIGIQFMILSFEKCLPYTDTLDENLAVKDFAFKKNSEDYEAAGKAKKWKEYTTGVAKCIDNEFSYYHPALINADEILRKEDEWKKEVERQREIRIANAQKEREAEKESVGNLFGRILTAIIVESANTYIKEKIVKELDIKTGTYHSQDGVYCHYSTPSGIKSIKKKLIEKKSIDYGSASPANKLKLPTKYQAQNSGTYSQRNTIYSFNEGARMKVTKRYYGGSCKARI